jgi:hypothetical protein
VSFELNRFSAQAWDSGAGLIRSAGASGGKIPLSTQPYYPGINDSLGATQPVRPSNPSSMTLFAAWQSQPARGSRMVEIALRWGAVDATSARRVR